MKSCVEPHNIDEGAVLNEEDSKEFILSWFSFFRSEYPRIGMMRGNVDDTDMIEHLALRTGKYYVSPPAHDGMNEVYKKLCKKYGTTNIAADPLVWYNMNMDNRVKMIIIAYSL